MCLISNRHSVVFEQRVELAIELQAECCGFGGGVVVRCCQLGALAAAVDARARVSGDGGLAQKERVQRLCGVDSIDVHFPAITTVIW